MDENDKSKSDAGPAAAKVDESIGQSPTTESARQYVSPASDRNGLFSFQRGRGGSSPSISAAPKKRKGVLILLISIAVLLGAFALAYVYWYQNPNKVVADGLSHAFNADSLTYAGTVTTVGSTKMNVDIDGGVSLDGGTVNAAFAFDTNDKKYTFQGNGLADAKGDLYLKVNSIDELVANYRSSIPNDTQPLFDQIIAKIDDKWIKISADDIKGFNPGLARIQECAVSAYKKLQTDEAVKSELKAAYSKHPFIIVDRVLGAKDGSLGYALTTDNTIFKGFAKEYKTTSLYKSLKDCDGSFTIDENKDAKGGDSKTKVDLWINRWSHQITRIVTKESEGGQSTNISIEPMFNRPVTVTTPKDVTTIEQLQKDIMSLLQTAQQSPAINTPTPQSAPTSAS